jgi:uncharacterized protein (DUF1778 family)
MALANSQKPERLEARLTPEQKELLQHAAALEGTSVTDFVVRIACQAAAQSIRDHSRLVLTVRESRDFVETLLNPPAPSDTLRAAAERYKRVAVRH